MFRYAQNWLQVRYETTNKEKLAKKKMNEWMDLGLALKGKTEELRIHAQQILGNNRFGLVNNEIGRTMQITNY